MSPLLDPGAVITRAVSIYRDNFAILFWAAAALFVVPAVLAIALNSTAGTAVASVLTLVIGTFYQGMVVELVRDVRDGRRDSSLGQLFGSVTPVAITLLAVAILYGLGVGIGIALLVIPGLFLMTIWAVTAPVVVIERSSVLGAFTRSQDLVRGNGWPVFTVILFAIVGIEIVRFLVQALTTGLGDGASAVITWAVTAATAPISALVAAVLYYALLDRHGRDA
ncbi:hypothetical protein [Conexibacter woesei]|uniref:hypothetical protein n=1 Tax=Conexibacter woesei TaxID=191495 RepID=UPI00040A45FA|nr:hypothetical protein [Conexibacter woesei]